MRYSKQREVIYRIVSNSYSHPNADEVYLEAKKEMPNISLGTVYRNLNSLCDNNLIQKIIVKDDSDHFDKTTDSHYHIICSNCHKITDIFFLENSKLYETIEKETGYIMKSHNFIFEGICNKCQKKEGE